MSSGAPDELLGSFSSRNSLLRDFGVNHAFGVTFGLCGLATDFMRTNLSLGLGFEGENRY